MGIDHSTGMFLLHADIPLYQAFGAVAAFFRDAVPRCAYPLDYWIVFHDGILLCQ